MLPHSQNWSSPHTHTLERKQEPLHYQGHPRWPAAHLPLWLSERQHLNCLLVYFPCQRQPLVGEEMETQGALVRSLHAWQRSLIQAHPEQSVLVMQRSKDGSGGCILPCRGTGAASSFPMPGPGTPVWPRLPAMSFPYWITAPKHSRVVWRKCDMGLTVNILNIDKKSRTISEIFSGDYFSVWVTLLALCFFVKFHF